MTKKSLIEIDQLLGKAIETARIKRAVKGEKGERGDKGDKGDQGIQGEKGDKGEQGEQGILGKDGLDGKNGKDGIDGKNGKDGMIGLPGKDGIDGSPDTPEQVRDKLESLKDEKRLDASAIKNLINYLNANRTFISAGGLRRISDLTTDITGILPVSNGGTGTGTQFTQGSVIFSGVNGVYSQNNANFFWDNTNNRLGIGTTAPSLALHVINSSGNIARFGSDTTNYINIVTGGVESRLDSSGTRPFKFNTGSGTVMTLLDSGNVGIGTTGPGSKLDVMGDNNQLYLSTTGTYSSIYPLASGVNTGALYWSNAGATVLEGRTATGYIAFGTGGTSLEKMRITSTGNVGIGTTGPSQLLSVGSGNNFTVTTSGQVVSAQLTADGLRLLGSSATNTIYNASQAINMTTNGYDISLGTAISAQNLIVKATTGNVGIGTTSPTAVLHIKAGTTAASSAPLKFTSGTNMTTAEAGAIEYDGTSYYATTSTPTRQKLAYSPTVNTRAGAFNTTYTPSTTRDTLVVASVEIATVAAGDGKVEAVSDSAAPPTTVRATVRIATALTDITSVMSFICKANENYRLNTTNNAGVNTFTLIGNIQEYVI